MRPDARIWRKATRAAAKGIARGRRSTHLVEPTLPRPRSSWHRRHPQVSLHDCPCHGIPRPEEVA